MPIAVPAATLGAGVIGGLASNSAAKTAAKATQQATDQSLALQKQMYDQTRSDLQPYTQAGYGGLTALQARMGLGGAAATGGGGIDWNAYGAANPDLSAEAQRVGADGEFASPQAYYQWHQQQFGDEGRDPASYATTPAPSPAAGGAGSAPAGGTYGSTDNPAYQYSPYTAPTPFSYSLSDYTQSPAYQAQLAQGINAIQSTQAARGALGSGATLKALQTFGQNLALQDFQNERAFAAGQYNTDRNFSQSVYDDNASRQRANYENDRNYLSSRYDQGTSGLQYLSSLGANAAGGLSSAGQAYGNSTGNLLAANAKAQGGAATSYAQNLAAMLNSGTNFISDPGVQNYLKIKQP